MIGRDDVDQEADDGHDDRDRGDDPLHGEVVALHDVVGDRVAEALPLEGPLGEYGAAEKHRNLQSHDGDDRNHRVPEGVFTHHAPLRNAPSPGRLDVVRSHRL